VLRYVAEDSGSRETQEEVSNSTDGDTYTVQAGDSLWSIAEKVYGSGTYYTKLMNLNGLANANIMVGQVLKIKSKPQSASQPAQSTPSTSGLPTLRKGSKGEPVRALQALLILRGQKLTTYGTDGDFGSETEIALRAY
jgi:Tfp pilus assembly protein FimV